MTRPLRARGSCGLTLTSAMDVLWIVSAPEIESDSIMRAQTSAMTVAKTDVKRAPAASPERSNKRMKKSTGNVMTDESEVSIAETLGTSEKAGSGGSEESCSAVGSSDDENMRTLSLGSDVEANGSSQKKKNAEGDVEAPEADVLVAAGGGDLRRGDAARDARPGAQLRPAGYLRGK